MTFDVIPAGTEVFLDANTLIYHFTNHPKYGSACTRLLERIETQELRGYISSHVMADVGHRLMTIEAMNRLNWPMSRLAARLKKHHPEIPTLNLYRQALVKMGQMGLQVIAVSESLVLAAAVLSQQFELLTGDALVIAVMQAHGLRNLASEDADFDRVPALSRYAPL
jgi:predicted nucleic acid-binding protein